MIHRKKHPRRFLLLLPIFASLLLLLAGFLLPRYFSVMLPKTLYVSVDAGSFWTLQIPFCSGTLQSDSKEVLLCSGSDIPSDQIHVSSNERVSIQATKSGSYQLSFKLFGILPLHPITVEAGSARIVQVSGEIVGIYLKTSGILVVGTSEITDAAGQIHTPAENFLQSGDYILAVDGTPVTKKEDLSSLVRQSDGKDLLLTVRRNGQEFPIRIHPCADSSGTYYLGAWVRDDSQGIGTLTYYETGGSFGALGHGISDADTASLLSVDGGSLYASTIRGITKGADGVPGSLSGLICYGDSYYLGEVAKNCSGGIFGTLTQPAISSLAGTAIPVGYAQEVHTGAATILSSISGQVKEYTIDIERIHLFDDENKSIVLRVTDPELLETTGGIVQGMSGSPILQDGKLIGAVTHVFVSDSTKGYGIFLESMLDAAP